MKYKESMIEYCIRMMIKSDKKLEKLNEKESK